MFERLAEAIVVMIVGISAVFSSLVFFYLLIVILMAVDKKINAKKVLSKLKPTSIVKDEESLEVINPEIVAVIAAAAYEMFNKPIVIKKIHYLNQSAGTSWAESGRLTVMGSHNIRK